MVGDSLPEGWKWVILEDVQHPDKRAIVSGPFGSNISSRFFVPSGVPVIRGNNLTADMTRYIDDGYVFLTEEKAKEFKNCEAYPNDLIFTAAGTLGQVGIIPPDAKYPRYIISNKQMRARVDEKVILPLYAFYWLASPDMVEYIIQRNTGSSVPLINLSVLRQLPIPLAPISEQKEIVRILGALDDKIELNRRINRTLESMAQAIFKSWFVDFDPVVAKSEGRQPFGMNADAAALFPAEFVDSKLGIIPKGWKIEKLGKICEFAYGKSLTAENRHPGNIAVFGSDGQIDWHDTALVKGPGIVVGRKGNAGKVNWSFGDFFPIDTTFYIVPLMSNIPMTYQFYALQSLDLENLSSDSAVPGLNREMTYLLNMVLPPDDLLMSFDHFVGNLLSKIGLNQAESRILASIRDALLPKLLSGEIRVMDAEKTVSEAI